MQYVSFEIEMAKRLAERFGGRKEIISAAVEETPTTAVLAVATEVSILIRDINV